MVESLSKSNDPTKLWQVFEKSWPPLAEPCFSGSDSKCFTDYNLVWKDSNFSEINLFLQKPELWLRHLGPSLSRSGLRTAGLAPLWRDVSVGTELHSVSVTRRLQRPKLCSSVNKVQRGSFCLLSLNLHIPSCPGRPAPAGGWDIPHQECSGESIFIKSHRCWPLATPVPGPRLHVTVWPLLGTSSSFQMGPEQSCRQIWLCPGFLPPLTSPNNY